uniref:Uncharacterized protein n=2 Tax=Anguilla anguilla TaxID=7936 RepID=A0A0E9RLJ1_ANGAN
MSGGRLVSPLVLNLVEILYLCTRAVTKCMDKKQGYMVTRVTPVLQRNEFKNKDLAIQNWVNLELELQGRKLGSGSLKAWNQRTLAPTWRRSTSELLL